MSEFIDKALAKIEEDKKQKAYLRQHNLKQLARDLYIHKDVAPKQAFDMAQEFIDLQYDTDYSKIRTMKRPIHVRYIVEQDNPVGHKGTTDIHIACSAISGFKTMHFNRYKGTPKDIPSFVENEAREQIDELLKEHDKRAGEINLSKVSNFIGAY